MKLVSSLLILLKFKKVLIYYSTRQYTLMVWSLTNHGDNPILIKLIYYFWFSLFNDAVSTLD